MSSPMSRRLRLQLLLFALSLHLLHRLREPHASRGKVLRELAKGTARCVGLVILASGEALELVEPRRVPRPAHGPDATLLGVRAERPEAVHLRAGRAHGLRANAEARAVPVAELGE